MFNELNTTEEMLLAAAQDCGWTYVPVEEIPREKTDVLVEPWLKASLLNLNPGLTDDQADEVISRLRAVITNINGPEDIITANQLFREQLFEKNSYPFGKDGEHVAIKFFDFKDVTNNHLVVTRQWIYANPGQRNNDKRFDLVFIINGQPMVIGEAKTPVRPSVTWADGASDIRDYENSVPAMFAANVFNFASEGKEYHYAGIGAPIDKWGPWYCGCERQAPSLAAVKRSFETMVTPDQVLDIYRSFTIFATDKKNRKIKVVCRYQQYEGANAIVERVLAGYPKKGLIWHFQGSGKSLLMVFAAQKLRLQEALKAPTVVIVDDRIDLEEQITADFMSADIPNTEGASTGEALEEFFKQDQRKILITTIFKFGGITKCLNDRSNIIVMVDEAHRTQEGDLGTYMRKALPNAFFFGLTGTPISELDHNTFATFGADEDREGYMSKYSFQDSIDDHATLELKFQTVPVELHIDKDKLTEEFDALTDQISDDEKKQLVRKTSVEALFTAPDRIRKVCTHIFNHFRESVEPSGLKAQLVVYNRACCLAYKHELDLLFGNEEVSTIVIDTGDDKAGKYKQWARTRDEQNKLLDRFRDPLDPLKIVIVTSKLLTGFDAPILQCMYLDKPMKNHTLLQAICRTNRVYDAQKTCGLIVDYVGVFDDVAKALTYKDEDIRKVVKNIEEIRDQIPTLLQNCLDFFPGVDRKIGGFEGLQAAQEKLPTNEIRDNFAMHYNTLHRAWEIVMPDKSLLPFSEDYIWLGQVYESVKPITSGGGSLIWKILGPKTIELIHRNVQTVDIGTTLEDLVLNSSILDAAISEADTKKKIREVEQILKLRLQRHKDDPKFKAIAEKVEELRAKMEQELISSIDFLKGLLETAKDVLEAEKENVPEDKRAKAKAALTELFESIKTPETPIIVEHVVNDIDEQVVRIVRNFNDVFNTVAGKREVRQQLRSILWLKYKIKDPEVFDKAYNYIEMYY